MENFRLSLRLTVCRTVSISWKPSSRLPRTRKLKFILAKAGMVMDGELMEFRGGLLPAIPLTKRAGSSPPLNGYWQIRALRQRLRLPVCAADHVRFMQRHQCAVVHNDTTIDNRRANVRLLGRINKR